MAPKRGQKRPSATVVTRTAKRRQVINSQDSGDEVIGDIIIESQANELGVSQNNNVNHTHISSENTSSGSNTLSNTVNPQVPQQVSQLIGQNTLTSILNSADVAALQAQNQQLQTQMLEMQRQLQPFLNTIQETSSSRSTFSDNGTNRVVDSSRTYLDIRTAFKAFPEFTGDDKGIAVASFIKQCKDLHSKIHPNEHANFFVVIKSNIKGQAHDLISDSIDTVSNLKELIVLLTDLFISTTDIIDSREALRSIKQEQNESIQAYGGRVSALLAKAQSIAKQNSSEAELIGELKYLKIDAINGFINGLKSNFIRGLLSDKKPDTLKDAIQRARSISDRNNQNQLNSNQGRANGTIGRASVNAMSARSDIKCYNCFKQGHGLKTCRSKDKCFFCKKSGHIGQKCYTHNTCFSCGKKGHLDHNCYSKSKKVPQNNQRKKSVVCYNCNKPGHYEKDCWSPKKVKNESNGENQNSSNHLNSKGAPCHQGQRGNVFVANGNVTG